MSETKKLMSAVVLLGLAAFPTASLGDNIEVTFNVPLDPNQITGTVWNLWSSPWQTINPPARLDAEQTLTANFIFTGGKAVKLEDTYYDSDESIHVYFESGGGGAPFVDIKLWFTGIQGGPPKDGTGPNDPIEHRLLGSSGGNWDINLVTRGSFSFTDVHVEVKPTGNLSTWVINRIWVGFDAETVTIIPEPASLTLLVVGGLLGLRRRGHGA